ncbi:MAG: FtsW/RodA/SpoVE family cell cycle protein [Planctomycetota bacterium]|jgi:cell division protein FtsW
MLTENTDRSSLPDSIAMVVILLMGFGTVFVFSAAANLSQTIDLQRFYEDLRLRQIIFFPLAIILMFAFSTVKYQHLSFEKGLLKSPVIYLLVLSIALVALVFSQRFFAFLPDIIPPINQHYRWLKIPIGPITISFQPSELAKWTLIIFLAAFCCKYSDRIKLYFKGFMPLCCVIALVVGLIILEDFGTAAFIAMLSFCVLIIAGVKFWHVLTLVPPGVCAFFLALIASPHRLRRIQAFLNPQDWSDSVGYQANQSLIAISSGGILGKGLGRGISKYGHLPEDTTDFIFAIIGEEFGFVGSAAVILLFIIFIWLGILVVIRCKDRFGQLLAGGIVLAIGIQAALNLGVVTVVLPTKGIPLPFVSSGGTSLLLSSVAVGLLLNIAKQTTKEIPEEIPQ